MLRFSADVIISLRHDHQHWKNNDVIRPGPRGRRGRPQALGNPGLSLTKGPLEYDAEKQELISRSAKLAYPIRDGIPIMLVDEARKLD